MVQSSGGERYGLTVIQTPSDLTQIDSNSQHAEILFRTLTKFKLFQGRTLSGSDFLKGNAVANLDISV